MISQSPEDRQLYEARQKLFHDEQARFMAARLEGHEEGRADGHEEGRKTALIDTVPMLEDLLGYAQTDIDTLMCLSHSAS